MRLFAHILLFSQSVRRDPKALLKVFSFRAWRRLLTLKKVKMQQSPWTFFHSLHNLRHKQRRQEHLASLNLPIAGRTVLELGAGVGLHTTFFLDRGCQVVSVDARKENIDAFLRIYNEVPKYDLRTNVKVVLADIENSGHIRLDVAEIVYCYGLLYHLKDPKKAIRWISDHCTSLCLLETCVSLGNHEAINPISEDSSGLGAGITGIGCRPTRPWVFHRLGDAFEYVYMPRTQPWHEQFPIDWSANAKLGKITRAIFIAAREPIENPVLVHEIPMYQTRS